MNTVGPPRRLEPRGHAAAGGRARSGEGGAQGRPDTANGVSPLNIDVRAVLADPRFTVPPAADGAPPGGIGWLRASVARFSTGADHARRRALAVGELARMDPAALRHTAYDRAAALLRDGHTVEDVARRVPAGLLADAMGVADVPVEAVAAVARAYHPHTDADAAADTGVAELVAAFGGSADEATAARIGLLIQAYDATAGLIRNAVARRRAGVPVDALLADTLSNDPPVRVTRRVIDGTVVQLDLAAAGLPFGDGPRPCPARDHALAIAAGVIEAAFA